MSAAIIMDLQDVTAGQTYWLIEYTDPTTGLMYWMATGLWNADVNQATRFITQTAATTQSKAEHAPDKKLPLTVTSHVWT